jgi:CRISPR-associated protein Csb2
MILQIEVTFTAGHFHGEEWPPSPARLFQALVAASHHGAHGLIHQAPRDEALRWLEQQSPPVVLAPDAVRQQDHLVSYLPNNDDLFEPQGHKKSAERGLGGWFINSAPTVVFEWRGSGSTEERRHADVVCAIARLVNYLGRTVDSARASGRVLQSVPAVDSTGRNRWQPRESRGGRWLAPAPGFLDLLNRRFPRSVSAEPPDFTNTRQVDYATDDELRLDAPIAVLELLRLDGRKLAFAPRDLRQPAGMVRNAMLQWAAADSAIHQHFGVDRIARLLQGHKSATSRERSEGGHFAVVPLPSVNPPKFTADGWMRRVAVVGYGLASAVDRELFDEVSRGLHGASLMDNGHPRGELRLLTAREQARVLYPFLGPARRWRSVTPVILTGFTRRGRSAESCLARALSQQRLPLEEIESLATFSGPIVPTAERAPDYRVQGYLATTPRFHTEIFFRRPVRGPLIVGRGRFSGFGLLIPFSS